LAIMQRFVEMAAVPSRGRFRLLSVSALFLMGASRKLLGKGFARPERTRRATRTGMRRGCEPSAPRVASARTRQSC
jgi:hypothetical protein